MFRYIVLLCLGCLVTSSLALAQVCGCPSTATCKPCSGGYTSVTLRYNGITTALVLITDGQSTLANLTLSPLQEFTITGSKPNEKFADKQVPVLLNGLPNTLLGPACNELKVGVTYGAFTVIAAVSKGGSSVCCTTPPPDVTPPELVNTPNTIEAQITSSCTSQVTWTEPTASDNCTLKSFVSSHKPGDSFPLGTTIVTYTATDEAGLVATSSFNVVVSDQNPPRFINTTADIIVAADESCSAIVTWTEPEVVDECDVTLTESHRPNDRFAIGATQVQYNATDASGNTASSFFNVIVEDRESPVFNSFPANITAESSLACSARVTWNPPVTTDKCSAVKLISTHQPNDEFALGTTVVKYTAEDESGNQITKEFMVNVEDKRKLEITNCPSDISVVAAEENSLTKVSWLQPSYTGLCEEITLESNHKPFDLFPLGETLVEYAASTQSGKIAYCRFMVRVALPEKSLEISKLITPDGDGHNDEWILANIKDYRDNTVRVFDRWGGIVFEGSKYDNESIVWRGTNRAGVSVPTGTYFYVIVASKGEKRIQEAGSVELVR